jgi:hypothetical protein
MLYVPQNSSTSQVVGVLEDSDMDDFAPCAMTFLESLTAKERVQVISVNVLKPVSGLWMLSDPPQIADSLPQIANSDSRGKGTNGDSRHLWAFFAIVSVGHRMAD